MNNVILMGRICITPELKTTPNGIYVTSFNLAVNRKFSKEEVDFITIVAWRKTAEFICEYFKKGSLIALQGSIQTRNYKDKAGNTRTAIEVLAEQVYFTGEKSDSKNDDFVEITGDDELPF